jgi:MinD-like ATPase involved in chromosome partitioning or flagellar assembly
MGTIGLAAMAISVLVTTPTQAQVAPTSSVVDYDTFMQQDVQSRIRVFNQVSPENRAELVQTQIKRWVEKNRTRLTPEQLKVMDENLAFVVADRYRQAMNEEQRAKAKELEARTAALFSPEDMREALTINGTYIPKKASNLTAHHDMRSNFSLQPTARVSSCEGSKERARRG